MPYDPGSPPRRAVENEAPRSRQPPSWENRLVIHRMRGLRTRASSSVLCLALVTVACGGGEPSLTDYVDQMNAAVAEAEQKAEELTSSEEDVSDFTPQVLEAGLLRGLAEIRIPLQTAVDDIEAPEQIADLHDRLWAWHRSFIEVEQALADRAATTPDTTNGWTGLSDSPEMGAYRSAIAEGKQLCISPEPARRHRGTRRVRRRAVASRTDERSRDRRFGLPLVPGRPLDGVPLPSARRRILTLPVRPAQTVGWSQSGSSKLRISMR